MYSIHPGKTMNEVMLDRSKKRINSQYKEDYEYIKKQGRYLALKYGDMQHDIFAFYDTESKKLVKFNGHNIWLSVEQFKDDWFLDTKKTDMRPWQDYVVLLDINNDDKDGYNITIEHCNFKDPRTSGDLLDCEDIILSGGI